MVDLYSSLSLFCLHCHAQKEKSVELNVLMSAVLSFPGFDGVSTHHSCNMVTLDISPPYSTAYLTFLEHCVYIRVFSLFLVVSHVRLIHGNTASM